jgi:formylglycine-generating enzyme required for sulfatase activity
MASKLAPFAELSVFESLDAAKRLALAAPLAESLGKDFRPLPQLVGSKGMVAVEHVPSEVELVAVPGGTFEMGFTERDDEEIKRCVDYDSGVVQSWLQKIEKWASPVRAVVVSPFLLSRSHLEPQQVAAVGGPRTDDISLVAAARLPNVLKDFRLPSEAELEYAGRDGGAVSFINDSGRIWSKTREWPQESAWGFLAMNDAAWAGDEWHETYEGAPTTSAPWKAAGPPGVYRGCLMEPPRSDDELLFALAASRGRMLGKPEDDWPVGLRIARSMSI